MTFLLEKYLPTVMEILPMLNLKDLVESIAFSCEKLLLGFI